jgi:hypothetical protein
MLSSLESIEVVELVSAVEMLMVPVQVAPD